MFGWRGDLYEEGDPLRHALRATSLGGPGEVKEGDWLALVECGEECGDIEEVP